MSCNPETPIADFRLKQWDDFVKETCLHSFPGTLKQRQVSNLLGVKFDYKDPLATTCQLAIVWFNVEDYPLQADWYLSDFTRRVRRHIIEYANPRYSTGNATTDPLSKYTLQDIDRQLEKYLTRFGKNQRGDERELDLCKMMHYFCVGWHLKEQDLLKNSIYESKFQGEF